MTAGRQDDLWWSRGGRPILAALPLLLSACPGGRAQAPPPAPSAAPASPRAGSGRGACAGLPLIRFAEPLCARLASGDKRITLRARHRTAIAPGAAVQLVCIESRRRWSARIVSVRHTSWGAISEQELRDDGFSGRGQLLPVMRRYYPGIEASDPATVYRWARGRGCAAPHPPGPLQ